MYSELYLPYLRDSYRLMHAIFRSISRRSVSILVDYTLVDAIVRASILLIVAAISSMALADVYSQKALG